MLRLSLTTAIPLGPTYDDEWERNANMKQPAKLTITRINQLADETTASYDLIFIDADKMSYPNYLATILNCSLPDQSTPRLLRKGGVIIADNVLRRGLVADSSEKNPNRTITHSSWREQDMDALRHFNDDISKNIRLETFLMPLFDGLGMARMRD